MYSEAHIILDAILSLGVLCLWNFIVMVIVLSISVEGGSMGILYKMHNIFYHIEKGTRYAWE